MVGGPDDVEAAVDVYVRSGTARHRGERMLHARIEQVRDTIRRDESWLFAADDDGERLGMAVAMPSREDFGAGPLVPGLCYLDLIFVVPERWGEGIGALLLDSVSSDARLRGFSRIHLLSHDDNSRAQALYRSRGFALTGWSHAASDPTQGAVSEWSRDL